MRNELRATVSINSTQIHPMVRCGKVPFGNANCRRPSAKAAMAARAWIWIAMGAPSNGAKVMDSPGVRWAADLGRAKLAAYNVNVINFHIGRRQGPSR